jgi:hypothetical protein
MGDMLPLLVALLPLDLVAPAASPGPAGLTVTLELSPERYRITHTWKGAAPMRFVTGAADRNCEDPVDALVAYGKVVALHSELPCGGFAWRSTRLIRPGESWTIEGHTPWGVRRAAARYCPSEADLKGIDPAVRKVKEPPFWLGCVDSKEQIMDEVIHGQRSERSFLLGDTVSAVKISPEMERPDELAKYGIDGEPLVAVDRKNKRVVVNDKHLSDWKRADATRLSTGERVAVGTVKSAALRARPHDLVRFLVESELLRTFVHVESELRFKEEKDEPGRYRARLEGTHTYYTNEQNVDPVSFTFELDKKTGRVEVMR